MYVVWHSSTSPPLPCIQSVIVRVHARVTWLDSMSVCQVCLVREWRAASLEKLRWLWLEHDPTLLTVVCPTPTPTPHPISVRRSPAFHLPAMHSSEMSPPPHYLVSFHRNFCHHVAPQRSRRTDNRAKNIEWIGKSMFGISRWLEAKLSNNAMVCEGMFTRPPPLPGHLSMTAAHHTTLTPRGSQIFFYHQSSTRKSK